MDRRKELDELRVRVSKNRGDGSTGPHVHFGDSNTPIFDALARQCNVTSREKGFWGPPEFMDKIAGKLALVHSEVTEILEALRKSQGTDKVTEEFADVFIRCFDLHYVLVENGMADPDLLGVIEAKMKTNAARPPKHGHVWG